MTADLTAQQISVVIPCYNKGALLQQCVGSVLSQSVQPGEIIIVDDGSTDASGQIAETLAKDHPHVRFHRKENGGVSHARNYGIERAAGEYIIALDADDRMGAGYLEKVISAISSTGANLVSCGVELTGDETGEWIPEQYDPYVERYHNVIPTLVTYKKELWQRIGGYSTAFVFNEDWDFFIRAEEFPLRVVQIPEKLLFYHVDSSGLAQQFIKDTWNHSVSLMMTSNEAKYPLEKLYKAHTTLGLMPQRWFERFQQQIVKYPSEWLLSFWLGLVHRSKAEVDRAKECFEKAIDLSGGKNWQPFFCLSTIARGEGDRSLELECLHWVRLQRPDTEAAINPRIKSQ